MRNTCRSGTLVPAAAWLLLGLALPAGAAEAPTVEEAFLQHAPDLIKLFKARNCRNVGVLKFLTRHEGDKGYSDNAGTLNMLLARRLEVALVLANDAMNPLGVIRNASAVAALTPGANHRNAPGRAKLFEAEYPLAWGKEIVKADAFVTGNAFISKDLQKLTIRLIAFDRVLNKAEVVGKEIEARIDAAKLTEMNESFVVRGLSDGDEVVKNAVKIKNGVVRHPLQAGTLPVALEVLYDGKRVKITYRDGKAFLPEPREGQKVAFRLRRTRSGERYGVVLKVNGENTIGRQRGPDLSCRRWILGPKAGPITITGYQLDDQTAERFHVLSAAESKVRAMNYGPDVGTISLTVYRERRTDAQNQPMLDPNKERALVVARADLPEKKKNLSSLKEALLADTNDEETRALIAPGEKEKSTMKKSAFQPDPTPLMSVTLIYYRP